MPVRPPFSFHPLIGAVLAASFAALGTSVLAAEHAAPVKAPASAASAREAAAESEPKAKGEKEAPKRAVATPKNVDPLEHVRERLAEKLGASKAADAPEPNVVRVATRPAAPAAEHAPRPKAAAHAVAATPSAAHLAAAHRATPGADAGHAHWDYAGSGGPESWGQMNPEFARCSSGTRQSPIDIRDGIKVNLDPVQFDYKPSAFRVLDNGHTVQVNVGPGNSIDVGGRRFDLVQFHFHRPSEERVNGKQFDMVAHLVHKDIDGRLAVVAVLLDRGSAHPLVQSVWNNLPLEKGDEVAARTTLDLNALLPAERSYFTYMGSLTTPPCSEGVLWMVMKTPMPISTDQIGIFARLYPMNARPIQSVSGRLIKESN
jgi:carbonic anhydrase